MAEARFTYLRGLQPFFLSASNDNAFRVAKDTERTLKVGSSPPYQSAQSAGPK